MRQFLEEYSKHAALNFGQALHGAGHLLSHPQIDPIAPRGSFAHARRSLALRTWRFANDIVFALLPPHWHHTRDELSSFRGVSFDRWFQYGYCAWRFDETGKPKTPLPADVDTRWDPRCDDAKL